MDFVNVASQEFQWNAGTVRALRAFMRQSQSVFAQELGVRQQTVSEWETGIYKPRGASTKILTIIARTVGFLSSGSIVSPVQQQSFPGFQDPHPVAMSMGSRTSFPPPAPGTLVSKNGSDPTLDGGPIQLPNGDSALPRPSRLLNSIPRSTRQGEVPI